MGVLSSYFLKRYAKLEVFNNPLFTKKAIKKVGQANLLKNYFASG